MVTGVFGELPFGGLMFLPIGSGVLNLRNTANTQLTQQQRSEQASKSFFIYGYDWSFGGCQLHLADNVCKYTEEIDNGIILKVSVSYILAIVYIDKDMYSTCGSVVLLDNIGGSGAATGGTTISSSSRQFSFVGNARTVNCVLGFLMLDTIRTISSDTFIRLYGALPTVTITVGPMPNQILAFATQATVTFVVQPINSPPIMDNCMSLEDAPNRSTILSSSACLTPPISTYAATQGSTCQRAFFPHDGRLENVCVPCGTTSSGYYYVLEDSAMAWANPKIAFRDQAGKGSVRIAGARIRIDTGRVDTVDPTQPFISGSLLADPPWTFCAESFVADDCAPSAGEAVGGVQVPADFSRYGLRIVNRTDRAKLCQPGTLECAAECAGRQEGVRLDMCACASALCAVLRRNALPSSSRLFAQTAGGPLPSRLWFDVFDRAAPAVVLEHGYMDLEYRAASGAVSGILHVLPAPAGAASLGWYQIGPMEVSGSLSFAGGARVLALAMQTVDDQLVRVAVVGAPFNLSLPTPVTAFPGDDWAVPSTAPRNLAGSLRNVNLKLSRVVVASGAPHANTQCKPSPARRYIDEVVPAQQVAQQAVHFRVEYGAAAADPGGYGNATVFSIPVTVTAVNDAPRLVVPPNFTVAENEYAAIDGVSVSDVDADEVRRCPTTSTGSRCSQCCWRCSAPRAAPCLAVPCSSPAQPSPAQRRASAKRQHQLLPPPPHPPCCRS